MAANQQLASQKAGSIAITAKWLHFSSFVVDGETLEMGHTKIVECFEQLAQHSEAELNRVVQTAVCISNDEGEVLSDTPYNRIDPIGFHGPTAVGLDGKGITLKDISIIVNIDYKYYLTDLEGVAMVEQRNDVIDFLSIELHLGTLSVLLTGAYDYLTEIQ